MWYDIRNRLGKKVYLMSIFKETNKISNKQLMDLDDCYFLTAHFFEF